MSNNVEHLKTDESKVWGWVKPLVLKTIVGAVIAAALVGVVAVMVGTFSTLSLQLILTIVLVVGFSLFAWYDADVSSKRSSTFALIGVFVSLYLLVVGLLKIWVVIDSHAGNDEFNDYYYFDASAHIIGNFLQWIWLAVIARVALLHAHLLLNIHRKYPTSALRIVLQITMGLIGLTAVMLSLPHIFETIDYSEGYWRFFSAILILDVLGTVLIPLTDALFNRNKPVYVPHNVSINNEVQNGTPMVNPNFYQQPTGTLNTGQPVYIPPAQPVQPIPEVKNLHNSNPTPISGGIVFEAAPEASKALAWPRYVDGTPLPVLPDGNPDFTQVKRYL